MANVVLIPCWQRADFLSVTLEHILAADGCHENFYLFTLDRGYSDEVLQVAENFPLDKQIIKQPHHNYHGNSFNILEGYRHAYQRAVKTDSLVYLIEEDIWIAKDFFRFHEHIQWNYHNFAVSAVWCHVDWSPKPNIPNGIYCYRHYQSLGVSWTTDKLLLVMPHVNRRYYSRMDHYVKRMLSRSHVQNWHEQDGLINRIMELQDDSCIYPCIPRAFHAGFVGYNRPGEPLSGPLEERIERLRTMSENEMNDRSHVCRDIRHCNREGYPVDKYEFVTI